MVAAAALKREARARVMNSEKKRLPFTEVVKSA
jgi:hypothetical protein